jgi:hypothetical protein
MTFLDGKCLLLALKLNNVNPYFYDFDIYQSLDTDIPADLFLGQNQKKLLVIVSVSDFTDENKAFLSKVLGAVKYDMLTDALVLVLPKDKSFGINKLISNEKLSEILIFGQNPKDLGLSIETFLYAPFNIAGKSFLIAHPLEKIKLSTEYKKNLWSALQNLFPIK